MRTTFPRNGMTLIEVLVALMVLAIGVSALQLAMAKCLSVVGVARHRDVARELLRQVDLENPIDSKTIEEKSDSGDFKDYPGYEWEREIVMVDEENRPGLFKVTTRVVWSEKGLDAFEESIVYKYAPDAESVTSKVKAGP